MNLKFSLIVFLLPLFGIFIFLYMLGLNFNFPKLPKDSRNPNMYEILYYNTALISNDASFCRKISDKSYQSTNFAVKKGYQIKFLRSACFGELAIKKSDPK